MLDAPTTNDALIQRALDPDALEAWRLLHEFYHKPLVRHAIRSGLNPGEAEEVASHTLLTLSQRLSRRSFHHESSSFRRWLAETANRFIFEAHRIRRREKLSAMAVRAIQECLPPAFVPEDELLAREKMEAHLWSVCLARVRIDSSPKHWQIFESNVLSGENSSTVAKRFNTSPINVRVIRMRMIGRLKREWKQLAQQAVELPE
jgi:RNA polymerase sigma factor (sigma-70 family)